MSHPWQPRDFVVDHCGYMELQHLDIFLNDVRGCSVLFISDQLLVGFDNVRQFVSEIILNSVWGWVGWLSMLCMCTTLHRYAMCSTLTIPSGICYTQALYVPDFWPSHAWPQLASQPVGVQEPRWLSSNQDEQTVGSFLECCRAHREYSWKSRAHVRQRGQFSSPLSHRSSSCPTTQLSAQCRLGDIWVGIDHTQRISANIKPLWIRISRTAYRYLVLNATFFR